jgi:hypothetical protein
MKFVFRAIALCMQVNFQLIAKLVLMLLHVAAVNYSHPQGAKSFEDITIQRAIHVVIYKW